MAQTNSLNRLIESYRQKMIMGEKSIDIESMVRDRCKGCKKCKKEGRKGATLGCPDVMGDLPAFEKWVRVDQFVGEYMTGLAELAAKGSSPNLEWSTQLAEAKGMLDILDDCVNAAAEQEVRLRRLIPAAIAETNTLATDKGNDTPARDELLIKTYLWLRPQLSAQLNGSNWGTLDGRVFSSSIMGWWTVKFLEGLEGFNQEFRVRRVKHGETNEKIEIPFPPEQLVGNFLNYMGARKQYAVNDSVKREQKHRAGSIHNEEGTIEIADGASDDWHQYVYSSITEAILALPEPHRSVFQLKEIEGKSLAEIAEILGKTVDALKNIRRSGRRMLQELIPTRD